MTLRVLGSSGSSSRYLRNPTMEAGRVGSRSLFVKLVLWFIVLAESLFESQGFGWPDNALIYDSSPHGGVVVRDCLAPILLCRHCRPDCLFFMSCSNELPWFSRIIYLANILYIGTTCGTTSTGTCITDSRSVGWGLSRRVSVLIPVSPIRQPLFSVIYLRSVSAYLSGSPFRQCRAYINVPVVHLCTATHGRHFYLEIIKIPNSRL